MNSQFALPRPEYPRPDRQRSFVEGLDWLNLNGPWQFRFDDQRRGIDDRWFAPDNADWREQIIVPFCWESLAAWGEAENAGNDHYYSTRVFHNPLEVNRSNHRVAPRYEVGWYRREVIIPDEENWCAKNIILTIGAADFFTDGWCNGVHLGHHEGGYDPFEFDLTDALETLPDGTRRAVLVFRVEDPMDNKEQPVGKQWNWYTTTSGIWQTVWIEPRHATHISSFRVLTHVDTGRAGWIVRCENIENPNIEYSISLEITCPRGEKLFKILEVHDGLAEGFLEIEPLLLWDPNTPHLYDATLCLKDSEDRVLDCIETYFGMRKIESAPTHDANAPQALQLNGTPRYLRGALYQSYHPDGVYTAGDAATLRQDIEQAKRAGFNFLRVHIKLDDPLVLYYADTIGVMLMCDFPNFGEGGDTARGRARFEEMMRRGIERDWNHPSIVAWCLFNETWGFGGQNELVKMFPGYVAPEITPISDTSSTREAMQEAVGRGEVSVEAVKTENAPRLLVTEHLDAPTKLNNKSSHQWVQDIWEIAKTLDSTRLIEDMSVVYWDHLEFYGHGDTDINSWHFYLGDYQQARAHIQNIVEKTYRGSTFNSAEGFAQGVAPLINSEYGGVGALDGDVDVSWSFKFLTNEMRRHEKICAYIFTELHDVEWEYNGFFNYDRSPKEFGYDPEIINGANTLPIDFPPIERFAPGDRVLVPVASSHYGQRKQENITLRWRLSAMDAQGHMHASWNSGFERIDFPQFRVAPAKNIELTLPPFHALCRLNVEAISPDGKTVASNFVQMLSAGDYPAAVEHLDKALILRGWPSDWSESSWTHGQIDREHARAEDTCWGGGAGFYEWSLPLHGFDLSRARRIRVLVEASSKRVDASQTDSERVPSALRVNVNGLRVYQSHLVNHPHDSRGALTYLRGGRGAYGYLAHATIEGELLRHVVERTHDDHLYLRCEVPHETVSQNGLVIYGAECGRFPIPPTVIVEW